jgi:hypothetical protein
MGTADAEIAYLRTTLGVTGGTLNDLRMQAYGGTGTQSERASAFWKAGGATTGSLQELEKAYLRAKTGNASTVTLADLRAQWFANPTPPTPVGPVTKTYFANTMAGTDGAAAPTSMKVLGTGGTVTIQGNRLVINPGEGAYVGNTGVLIGDPTNRAGNAATGAPESVSDFSMTFRLQLTDAGEQYPSISFGVQDSTLWSGGGGDGLPQTGDIMVMIPSDNAIWFEQGYTAGTIDSTQPFVFPGTDMWMTLAVTGKRLQLKAWAFGASEPATWGLDLPTFRFNQSSGYVVFTASNGGSGVAKTVAISQLTSTTVVPARGPSQPAPSTVYAGFTRSFTENFDTAAPVGTGPTGFITAYANSFQPYDDSGKYFPRQVISAHDGVMDIALDGVRGAAGSFGTPATFNSRIGGRFAMRAMALGGWGNGSAVMIWPSATSEGPWSDGEIDYPEANFDMSPYLHHHHLGADPAASDDYLTGASWRDWHVYSIEWRPGVSVRYFLDEEPVATVTTNVPSTVHRYMFQVDNTGAPGNMFIDWVTIDPLT